jgi:SAM-dependent methyltransferase
MRVLEPSECVDELVCTACRSPALAFVDGQVQCAACRTRFDCLRGVIDFVDRDRLDADTLREEQANSVALENPKAVRRRLRKGKSGFLAAQTRRCMRSVLRLLEPYDETHTLISVGSGSGYELRALLGRRRFRRVYSSDLAWSATALVPQMLADAEGTLGLFAADFQRLPIQRRSDRVGLCYLALHHAPDPHHALSLLLERFDQLVMVEPVTNWLVKLLARFGQARRIEYSGVEPEWLDIGRMRKLADDLGFAFEVETWWEIPRLRLPRRVREDRRLWWPLFALVEGISQLTRPLRFGSMAAVRFRRVS